MRGSSPRACPCSAISTERKDRWNMALREIRETGDPVLNKVSKNVKEMTPRTAELITWCSTNRIPFTIRDSEPAE